MEALARSLVRSEGFLSPDAEVLQVSQNCLRLYTAFNAIWEYTDALINYLHLLSFAVLNLFPNCLRLQSLFFSLHFFLENFDRGSFAKLFVGSVPRTASEEDVS